MDADEYQKLAARTANDKEAVDTRLIIDLLGLASEVGEITGLFQHSLERNRDVGEEVYEELGDCLWRVADVCTCLGVTMSEIMGLNIAKLKARHPDGFNPDYKERN